MPEFKQKMTMHLNGGKKFSELHYAVTRDDQPTGITRSRRTAGSPKYLITDDVFTCGDAEFDMLKTGGVGIMAWLIEHSAPRGEA